MNPEKIFFNQFGKSLEKEVFFIANLAIDILNYTKLTQLHLGWLADFLQHRRLLFLAPRDHFKTTCATIVYPVYRILKNRKIKIILVHEKLDKAKGYLREIKGHLQRNEKLIAQFGEFDTDSDKWTETAISLVSGQMNPTISVTGTLSATQGGHCDLLILDDLISMKNSETAMQRHKVKQWIFQELLPVLEPDGQILIIGTRKHHGDFYGDILNEKGFLGWRKVVLKAEYPRGSKGAKKYGMILFPERWPKKKLRERKAAMGTVLYNSEYLNEPSSGGDKFNLDWLKFYKTEPKEMRIFEGVDLAISKKETAAYFAMVTIGIPAEGYVYVLNVFRDRLGFPGQCKAIKRLAQMWKPLQMGIENNAYQDAMPQWLDNDPEAKLIPFKGISTYGDKRMRIWGLSPLFERGNIFVRETESDFIDEFISFPDHGTFDILDALLKAIEASRGSDFVEPKISEIEL